MSYQPRFSSNIRVGAPGLDMDSLRKVAQCYPTEFAQRTKSLIDQGKLRWRDVRDLRGLFHAFGDVDVPTRVDVAGRVRTVTTSAFPLLAGNLSVAEINQAYEAVPTVGQDLVTDRDSMKKDMVVMGLLAEVHENMNVKEGEEFPLVGAGQERFDILNDRKGLRMQITQEMIEENDVDGIIDRLNFLGEVPAEEIEEKTLKRVTDHDGSASSGAEPYVLHINKAAAALYTTTANNPGTRAPSGTRVQNNALENETDLENVRSVLAGMLNSRGKRIANPVSRMQLLVPDALAPTAQKILNSELTPGLVNEVNPWGPRGSYRPNLVSTPKLDDLSTAAWYLGDFKRQFRRKWKLRIEQVTMAGDITNFLRSRIAFEARVAWDVEVGAIDYVYCVQSLSGTTAPKDE